MKTAFGICLLLALTACGGGGGSGDSGAGGGSGGGSGNAPPAPTPTFTLSGSVSGLSGSGLVVATNGQTLAVAANGTFAFPTPLASGTAYNVIVATQPDGPAQNCGVINGGGTLGNANITNIAIACTNVPALTLVSSAPAAGAIDVARAEQLVFDFSAALNAATVSTSSVELRDVMGAHIVDVSVSGAQLIVTPQRPLLPAAAYTLTINELIRGSGREAMSTPVSLSFTTRGSWQAAQLIENETSDAGEPLVAANGETVMVGWQQAGSFALKRYVSGTGWSGAEVAGLGAMAVPQLAIDAQGTAHIVWYENESTTVSSLKASHYTPASGFSPVELVENESTGRAFAPRIAVDPAGNLFAVWRYRVAVNSAWANRYSVGSGWGTAQEIDASPSDIATPGIAVDASGNALAVWTQETSGAIQLTTSIYTPGTGWGTPAAIGPASTAINTLTFGMNAAGQAVLLTSESGPTEDHVIATRATLGGNWSAPAQLDSDPRISGVSGQKVAIDAAGNAVAVWIERYVSSPQEIWSSRYSVDGGWSTAERIGVSGEIVFDLDVAVDRAGNALAVWTSYDSSPAADNIVASRYIAGRGWTPAVAIDPNNEHGVYNVRVAIDGDGNAVAVWNQHDGTSQSVEANRFE